MTAFLVRRFVGGKPEVELCRVEAETEIELLKEFAAPSSTRRKQAPNSDALAQSRYRRHLNLSPGRLPLVNSIPAFSSKVSGSPP